MLALTFQVGRDRVAVDVRRVREVVPRVHLQTPAGAPAWLAGLFVHRGRIVPVVDLHKLVDAGECPPHLSSRIVLVPFPGASDGSLLGLLATQVAEVRELTVEARPLDITSGTGPNLGPLLANGAEMIRMLDPETILPAEARLSLASIPTRGAM
jgi:chemotaxis-related protein WspB